MVKDFDPVRVPARPRGSGELQVGHERSDPSIALDIPRTIRRHELRMIVPLADTTIYDMELRGDFPRRFNLTSRSVVWDLGEVVDWLKQRRRDSQAGLIRRTPPPDVRQRRTRPVKV